MSLTQPQETHEQALTNYVNRLRKSFGMFGNQARSFILNQRKDIFNSPDFTPAEILAEFGTDAAAIFQNAVAMSQILNSQVDNPSQLLPLEAPIPLDFSKGDGSVVTKK